MLRYRLLIFIFSPLLLAYIVWLSIKNGSRRYLLQRLGFNYRSLPAYSLWIHCASVGEVNTVLPLLRNIHRLKPELKIIISTNTVTGGSIVEQQSLDYLYHCYLPFDWSFSIRRFLSAVKPTSLFLMETEIWPNLFSMCDKNSIAINIINARLSSKTTSAKPWIKAILKNSLSKVNAIYTRTDNDANAYMQLGADRDKVNTVGNLKLSTVLSCSETKEPFSCKREYILLASTHKDEESQIADIWKSLDRPELLIIAPRHPERAASIIKKLGYKNIASRSKNENITDKTEVYLLDTVGELKNYFSNAKLVIMGGSFEPIGGHNILEPASFNSVIITGPHMENFEQELTLMLKNNAINQVRSYAELKDTLINLLDEKSAREQLIENTKAMTHDVEKVLHDYTQLVLQ